MAMKFGPKFTIAEIRKQLAAKLEPFERAIVSRLRRIGEMFIANARNNDTYKDRTGNLRSSIGYLILKDGVQLEESFPGDKGEGTAQGKKIAEEVAQKYPRGIVLICVAGMDYALYVEAMGYDVLTVSSQTAENDLKKAVAQLSKKLR